MRLRRSLAAAAVSLAGLVGCATEDTIPATDEGAGGSEAALLCTPGKQTRCACPGAADGVQVCNDEGDAFGACECSGSPSTTSSTSGAGGGSDCGDGACGDGEDCHTCEADCGTCEPCTLGPSCDAAQIPPSAMTHVPSLDNVMAPMGKAQILARLAGRVDRGERGVRIVAAALEAPTAGEAMVVAALRETFDEHPALGARLRSQLERAGAATLRDLPQIDLDPPTYTAMDISYPGGTPECGAPLLRIRAATVVVHEEDDDFANDIVYCALSSEAMLGAEIRVTPKTPNLDEGDSHTFAIESGIFWGQAEPMTPGGNLLLTYDCFEADSSEGYGNLIGAIGQAAGQLGGIAGDNGWIFDTISAVAPVIQDAVALDSDDHLFNAQQTIDMSAQMDLTNGRFWSVRRSGTHINSDWDWELRVEAWGCAQYGEP